MRNEHVRTMMLMHSASKASQLVASAAEAAFEAQRGQGGRSAAGAVEGGAVEGARWRAQAGAKLASRAWREVASAAGHPVCAWSARRTWCAEYRGCAACAQYVARGTSFSWAPLSQRLLDALGSDGAYGSHAAAHAAGWRWDAAPNRNQRSHTHQWWPPQAAVDTHLGEEATLPLGTHRAMEVLEALFPHQR